MLEDIISKLPPNEEVAKDILKMLDNSKTKCVLDKDIKNSYYVYLNDTMYISDREKVKNNSSRICLVAHECWHSIQSKFIQKLNFIFSNLELLTFIIAAVLRIFTKFEIIVYIYYAIILLSLIFRIILEQDAVRNSIPLAKNYMEKYLSKNDTEFITAKYKKKINILYIPFFISLMIGKIVRGIIIFLIYFFI